MALVDLDVRANTRGALKNIQKFSKASSTSLSKVEDSFNAINTIAKLAVGFLAGRALLNAFGAVTEAAQLQENAVNNVNSALKRSGEFSKAASEDIVAFASALEDVTTFSGDAILESFALAKAFGFTAEQAKVATRAAIELSVAADLSLIESIRRVGRTISGSIADVSKFAEGINKLTKEELRAGKAADELIKSLSGTAAAQINTFSGAIAQLSNAFGGTLEKIGDLIIKNKSIIATIQTLKGSFKLLEAVVLDNQETIGIFISTGIGLLNTILKNIGPVIDIATRAFRLFISSLVVLSVAAFTKGLITLSASFLTASISAAALKLAIRGVFIATGIGAIVVGVDLLIGKFIELRKELLSFDNVFNILQKEFIIFINGLDIALNSFIARSLRNLQRGFGGLTNIFGATDLAVGILLDKNEELLGINKLIKKEIEEILVGIEKQKNALEVSIGAAKDLKDELNSIDLKKLEKELANAFKNPVQILIDAIKGIEVSFQKLGVSALGIAAAAAGGAPGAQGLLKTTVTAGATALGGPVAGPIAAELFDKLKGGADEVREAVREFAQEIPKVIISLIEAIPILIEELVLAVPDIIEALIDGIPRIISAIITSIPKIIKALIIAIPRVVTALARAMPLVAVELAKQMPQVAISLASEMPKVAVEFIKELAKAIPDLATGAVGGGGVGGGILGGIGDIFGFQKGGTFRGAVTKDSIPAIVAPNETIITSRLTDKLDTFIDKTNNLLNQLVNQSASREDVERNLSVIMQFEGSDLARALLKLNQRGLRTS